MYNISQEHKKKLQILIYNNDIESVIQGLDLLETIAEDIHDIYFVFDFEYPKVPASMDEIKAAIPNTDNQCFVVLWLLCEMLASGVEWVREIEELDLCGEGLSLVPDFIGDLTNLKKLDLSYNQLTEIPESIGNLTNLTELYLNDNNLSSLPDSLSNLYKGIRIVDGKPVGGIDIMVDSKLMETLVYLKIDAYCSMNDLHITTLSLRENKLTRLPESIGNLTTLTSLDLNLNRLIKIPESIGNLNQLVELDISQNYREFTLPDSIGQLQNLRTLNISTNKVTSIPHTIENLNNLEKLYIYGNKIQSLPNAICALTNLKELAAYKNQLTELPLQIGQLSKVEEISLYFNSLSLTEISRLRKIFGRKLKS